MVGLPSQASRRACRSGSPFRAEELLAILFFLHGHRLMSEVYSLQFTVCCLPLPFAVTIRSLQSESSVCSRQSAVGSLLIFNHQSSIFNDPASIFNDPASVIRLLWRAPLVPRSREPDQHQRASPPALSRAPDPRPSAIRAH